MIYKNEHINSTKKDKQIGDTAQRLSGSLASMKSAVQFLV